MKFENGHEKKGGRPPGAQNKTTKAVKEVLENVFTRIGGEEAFAKWAMKPHNRVEFYKLYAKLLPKDINVKNVEPNEPESIPAFNSWLASIAAKRAEKESKSTLPN